MSNTNTAEPREVIFALTVVNGRELKYVGRWLTKDTREEVYRSIKAPRENRARALAAIWLARNSHKFVGVNVKSDQLAWWVSVDAR